MTKIEDMTRPSSRLLQNSLRLLTNHILLRKQHNRIEISHHRNVMPDTLPTLIKPHTPIQPDHIATGFAHQLKQRCRSRSEMNNRNALRDILDHALRMRQHKLAVVIRAQTTDP